MKRTTISERKKFNFYTQLVIQLFKNEIKKSWESDNMEEKSLLMNTTSSLAANKFALICKLSSELINLLIHENENGDFAVD